MAYPVATLSTDSGGATTSVEVALPPHEAGDLLLIQVGQDTGTGTFSATGWSVIGTHAASNATRNGWLGLIAASSSTANPIVTSTLSDDIIATVWVIRDADVSGGTVASALHLTAKADQTSNGMQTSPSATTTVDNCLLLYSFGFDGAGVTAPMLGEVIWVARVDSNGFVNQASGYYQQQAQGAVPTATAHCTANDGGTSWVLAIKNASGGAIAPAITRSAESLMLFSGISTDTNLSATALSNTAATIDGKTVDTNALVLSTSQVDDYSPGGSYEIHASSASLTDRWVGSRWALASTVNLTNKVVSVSWRVTTNPVGYGGDGWIVVFEDNAGKWVAHRLLRPSQTEASKPYNSIIKVNGATALDSGGGSIDWSQIVAIGFAYHRVTAAGTSTKSMAIKRVIAIEAPIFVGGSAAVPVSAGVIASVFTRNGIGLPGLYDSQGEGQALLRSSVQIGNGSLQTYYKALGTSIEFPSDFVALGNQKFWNVPTNGVSITVYASATDTIDFRAGSIRAASRQTFQIHASSSPSATYDFAGATFLGLDVIWQSGITCNGANFVGCYGVTANGGTLEGCTFTDSQGTALTTADPEEISDCPFISSGAGHAIEITTPGTYSFVGNTFSGYGADATTDAAIYNNSGGAVTLNISGGGGTPTVRNGAGATTTINNNVSITLDGVVVGSSIRVEKVSDGSLVEFRTATGTTEVFSVAGSVAYKIKVRKGTSATKYLPFDTQTASLSGDASIFVAQVEDLIAA